METIKRGQTREKGLEKKIYSIGSSEPDCFPLFLLPLLFLSDRLELSLDCFLDLSFLDLEELERRLSLRPSG